MKRLLIIMGNHSPFPSSVANCVEPLLNKLTQRGYKIDIVTNRTRTSTPPFENINGINVYRVDDVRAMNTQLLQEHRKIKSAPLLRFLTIFFSLFLKVAYYFKYVFFAREKVTGGWRKKDVVNKCIELNSIKSYDAVMSISLPFKSHYIAYDFISKINTSMKWFIYEFDPYSLNESLVGNERRRRKYFQDEYKVFQKGDYIFLTQELFSFYKGTPFESFINKMYPVPYANMKEMRIGLTSDNVISMDEVNINCLYAGTLYKDIRNPDYAIKLFKKMDINIKLIFISNYNKKDFHSEPNENISIYPLQPKEFANEAMIKADILINIGNTVPYQIPGKIFEYMSLGKPIIHFSKMPNDPALKYLKNYPMILIVKEWENLIEKQTKEIKEFCEKYKGAKLEYKEVCSSLKGADSESVSEEFADIVDTMLKD